MLQLGISLSKQLKNCWFLEFRNTKTQNTKHLPPKMETPPAGTFLPLDVRFFSGSVGVSESKDN